MVKVKKLLAPILFKNIMDSFMRANPLGALSAPLYFVLNFKGIVTNVYSLSFIALFIPIVILNSDSLRSLISIIFVIFFGAVIKNKKQIINSQLIVFAIILCILMFIGTFYEGFYATFDYLTIKIKKYRFIYNDPNNFGPYACAYQAIMIYGYFKVKTKRLKSLIFFVVILTNYSIFKSLGRMYTAISLAQFLAFLSFKFGRKKVTKIALSLLVALLLLSINYFSFDDESGWMNRLVNLSLSGRDRIADVFFYHISNSALETIYGSTLSDYEHIKFSIFGLPQRGMSLCENSYMATVVNLGFMGLLYLLLIQIALLRLLFRQRLYISTLFTLLYFCIWYFDDSLIYPISVIHQGASMVAIYYCEVIYSNKTRFDGEKAITDISSGSGSIQD